MTEKGAAEDAATSNGESKPVHVMDLLKQFDFLSIGLGGKIHCAVTGRDLPLRVDAIQQHVNSKKLKKEKEWYSADFSKYEPLIVPHKVNPKLLYCTLTQMELNRIPQEVERHVNGKRFLNRKREMEGSKLSQRAPAEASSDEEFWSPGACEALEADDEEGEEDDMEDNDEESHSDSEEVMAEASMAAIEARQKGTKNRHQKQSREQTHVRLDEGKGKGKIVGKLTAEGRSGSLKSASSLGDSGNGVSTAKPTGKGGRNKAKKGGGTQNTQKGWPQLDTMRTGHAVPVGDANESKANNGAAPPSTEDKPRGNAKSRRQSKGKKGKGTPAKGTAAEEDGKGEGMVEAAPPAEKRKLEGAGVSRYRGKKRLKS